MEGLYTLQMARLLTVFYEITDEEYEKDNRRGRNGDITWIIYQI